MQQRFQTAAIGLFVLIGCIILGWLIMVFGEAPSAFLGKSYPVNIRFSRGISNTREGTEVMLGGKRIGQVRRIEFVDLNSLGRGVNVVAEIDTEYKLPRNSLAIESVTSPVMGRAIIMIDVRPDAGAADLPTDGSGLIMGQVQPMLDNVLPPSLIPTLEESFRQIGDLAGALTPVARELEKLVQERPLESADAAAAEMALANLSTVVQRFDAALKNFNTVFGDLDNQQNLAGAVANFRKASEDFVTLVSDAKGVASDFRAMAQEIKAGATDARKAVARVDEMMQGFSGAGVDTLEALGSAALALDNILSRIDQGKGTAGAFVNDNRLYESMLLTLDRMRATLDEFNAVLAAWKRGDLRFRVF